ncbi:MAG: cytochrome, partial [Cyanobacteria bacterium J06632_22]
QINVLTSQVVVACGLGAGTVSEIALALKAQRPVVLLAADDLTIRFCQQLTDDGLAVAPSVAVACRQVQSYLASMESSD